MQKCITAVKPHVEGFTYRVEGRVHSVGTSMTKSFHGSVFDAQRKQLRLFFTMSSLHTDWPLVVTRDITA